MNFQRRVATLISRGSIRPFLRDVQRTQPEVFTELVRQAQVLAAGTISALPEELL